MQVDAYSDSQIEIYNGHHVMICDEDLFMAKLLETVLISFGVGKVSLFHSHEDAIKYLETHNVDCIMLEWFGWEKPCLDFLSHIRKSGVVDDPMMPVIICTSHTDYSHVIRARDEGANEVVAKPFAPAHVFEKLYSALFKFRDFITDDDFTGPDRRRRIENFTGEDRRSNEALSQTEIDQLMVE